MLKGNSFLYIRYFLPQWHVGLKSCNIFGLSVLVQKVWVQDVKLQYSNLAGNPPQIRMKDYQFAPILWRKEDLVILEGLTNIL